MFQSVLWTSATFGTTAPAWQQLRETSEGILKYADKTEKDGQSNARAARKILLGMHASLTEHGTALELTIPVDLQPIAAPGHTRVNNDLQ